MNGSRFIVAAMIVGAIGATSAAAQGCADSESCSATNTASVTVGALVQLEMSSATTSLTAPTNDDLDIGYVADVGPSFVIHANQDWTMSIKADALNPTNWDYTGTKSGVKPIGDLTWSVEEDGTFAALTGSNVTVASDDAATDDTEVAIFFQTVYSSNYAAAKNRPGVYSLPVVFTLSAP